MWEICLHGLYTLPPQYILLFINQMRFKFKYKNRNIKVQTAVPIACFTSG